MSIDHITPQWDAFDGGSQNATDPVLHDLERYWRQLRRTNRIPSRSDVSATDIDAALPHAFMLQRVAPGIARMRVAGQKLHELLKMDARGMPFSTFFEDDTRDEIRDLVEQAFSTPSIVRIPLVSAKRLRRPELTGHMLLLPLRDDQGETTRVLGALVTKGTVGTRPRRFTLSAGAPPRCEPVLPHLVQVNHSKNLAETALLHRATREAPALQLVVNNA